MAAFAVPIVNQAAAAPFDPHISNGTCFLAAGKPHTGPYIPCGNAGASEAEGEGGRGGRVLPCCVAGDYCQSSGACYSPDTGNVYLAGCTDPEYKSSACPYKSEAFAGQEWVGMVWSCGVSSSSSSSSSTGKDRDEAPSPFENLFDSARRKEDSTATLGSSRVVRLNNISSGDNFLNLNLTTNHGSNNTGSGLISTAGHIHISNADADHADDDNETISWSGCPLPRPDSIVPERMYNMCDPCSPPRDGLFEDGRQLTRVARLPDGIGGVVVWESGFGPGTPGGFGLGSGGGGGAGTSIISLSPSVSSGMTATTMSSCVSTAGSGGAAATGIGAAEGSDNGGGGGSTHPAADRMNVIVGSVSAMVIVLLAAALTWLLMKRHQRKAQERRVVRETHLALARGPSPPQMVATSSSSSSRARGAGGLAPVRSLRVATGDGDGGYHGREGGEAGGGGDGMQRSPSLASSPLTTHVGSPGLLSSPMDSISRARARAPLRLDLVPETQRWSAATDHTVAMMEPITAQTTNTDHSSRTTLTPVSLSSSFPLLAATSTPLVARVRRQSSSFHGWDGAADDDDGGEFGHLPVSPTALALARKKSVLQQNSLSPIASTGFSPGSGKRLSIAGEIVVEMENLTDRQLHAHAKQSQQVQISVEDRVELSPGGRRRRRSVSAEPALKEDAREEEEEETRMTGRGEDSDSDDDYDAADGDDGQSVVSYRGGTIQHIKQMRMRIIDPNTAKVLILGKKGRDSGRGDVDGDGQDLVQGK